MSCKIEKVSAYEYKLSESEGGRVWIKVTSPGGKVSGDVGILVNGDGISIDLWPFHSIEQEEPLVSAWTDWSELRKEESEQE